MTGTGHFKNHYLSITPCTTDSAHAVTLPVEIQQRCRRLQTRDKLSNREKCNVHSLLSIMSKNCTSDNPFGLANNRPLTIELLPTRFYDRLFVRGPRCSKDSVCFPLREIVSTCSFRSRTIPFAPEARSEIIHSGIALQIIRVNKQAVILDRHCILGMEWLPLQNNR